MPGRRTVRRAAIAAAGLAGLLAGLALTAVLVLQGERLAAVARRLIPPMRGKIEVRSVRWQARALIDFLTDRPTPVTLEGLRITDPEGVLVLDAPRLEVKVPLRSAIGGRVYLHDLVVGSGSLWRFAALRGGLENGFLSSFQPAGKPVVPPPSPPPVAGPTTAPFVFQIVNARLLGLTAVFDFPAWGLELRELTGPVGLNIDGDFVGWDGTGLDAHRGGFLRILDEVLPFDRVLVNRVATTREWPDSIFLDVGAAKTGRSTLTAKGFFTEIYGYGYRRLPEPGIDLHAEIDDAADALRAVASTHALPRLRIAGPAAKVELDLKQPFSRMRIGARLSGLDLRFGDYEARDLGIRASLVTDPLSLEIDDVSFSAPGGGRLSLSGGLDGTKVKARLGLDRFTTTSYVPAALRRLAAGKLSGRIGLTADYGPKKQLTLDPVELHLVRASARARGAPIPGTLRVTGQVSASGQRIATEGLSIEVPGASAEVRGELQLARKMFSLGLRASTSDLPGLLSSIGVQPVARGVALSLEADGPFRSPRARGEVVVEGIGIPGLPEVPRLATRFHLDDGTLHVDSLSARAFGGTFEGRGQIGLFEHTLEHLLPSPLVSFRLDGRDVELATLVALGWASGKVSFTAAADGPLDKLRARVEIPPGATVQVFGSPWELRGIEVEADAQTLTIRTARLGRPSGAQVELSGRMTFGGPMEWTVAVRDVALEGLPGLAAVGVPITGQLSADLKATGSLTRPVLTGVLSLNRVTARGAKLGGGELVIRPVGDAGVRVVGNLFRRFDVEASATYGPGGPRVAGRVSFNRLALEDLLPELVELGDGRGVISGRVSVDVRPDAPLVVDARLTQLEASITRETLDQDGQPVPQRIWMRNSGELRVAMVGDKVVLEQARLVTDGGEFRVEGDLTGQAIRGSLLGHLNLDLLQPFLRRRLDRLTGDLVVDLKVAGSASHPDVQGRVAIDQPVHLQPQGNAPEVVIPSGSVILTGSSVKLANLSIAVDDSILTLRGEAQHDERYTPTSFQLDAAGDVSATLLETLASSAVSEASGVVHVKAHLAGTPAAPQISARLDLAEIELRLRNLGRLLTLESGTIELNSHELVLRDLKTRIDDQGRLFIGAAGARPGRIAIKRLFPKVELGRIDLPLKGEHIGYRVPGSIEIDDLSFTLALTGDLDDGLALGGEALVVSGRYLQDFQVKDLVISPRLPESSARPFYDGNDRLANLELDLRVRTVGDSFIVQNNLAPEIHVTMDLHATGTLAEPRLAGSVRPTDGRFHIPGLRGDFELVPNANYITFVDTKSLDSGYTPELNFEAQNDVRDAMGNEHTVRMRIRGPIGQAAIDLSSEEGLDRNQTLLLLVSGRTSEDSGRFGATQNPTLGSNLRTGTEIVGQITRDVLSSLVEPYIDDTLQLLTGRRINLRPTVGVDGFELRILARASRNTDLQLSFLRGFQNQQRYRAEGSLWLADYLSARGFWERLTLSPQQGISEDHQSANLELTIDFPFQGWTGLANSFRWFH